MRGEQPVSAKTKCAKPVTAKTKSAKPVTANGYTRYRETRYRERGRQRPIERPIEQGLLGPYPFPGPSPSTAPAARAHTHTHETIGFLHCCVDAATKVITQPPRAQGTARFRENKMCETRYRENQIRETRYREKIEINFVLII